MLGVINVQDDELEDDEHVGKAMMGGAICGIEDLQTTLYLMPRGSRRQ
jgi:hypothetical protein